MLFSLVVVVMVAGWFAIRGRVNSGLLEKVNLTDPTDDAAQEAECAQA